MINNPLNSLLKRDQERKIVNEFTNKFGLVYFGDVNQHSDEHQIIRGMTVSHTHRDLHYSVGTYQTYDVSFVKRVDTIKTARGINSSHKWLIMQVDLKSKHDFPHVFIGLHTHSESFYRQLFTKYTNLRQQHLGTLNAYKADFITQYRIYGLPSQHIEIERLLTPELAQMIQSHFQSLAVEIHENVLYVYSEDSLSNALLEAMIINTTWLADRIDESGYNV